MLNEKIITGLKSRLEMILKRYFTQYDIVEEKDKIIGKGFGSVAIIIDYANSQINYTIEKAFLDSFFKMNKLIVADKNLSTKYYCKPLSHSIMRMYNDYLEQPLAPLTESDLTDLTTVAINGESIESIAFDTFFLPVYDKKKKVKEQKFDVLIVSTAKRDYAFKILEIIDNNIKSELSRELLRFFAASINDIDGLVTQLSGAQSGLEGMLAAFGEQGADIGF